MSSTVTRNVSTLRRLVPFKFDVCGPVAEVTRQVFNQYPHIFPTMLATLERLDTAAEPRISFADALQRLADEGSRQAQIRDAFDIAEVHARQEFFQNWYDPKRCEFDFNYRLDSLQLIGAVQYWARMFRVHPSPRIDAVGQLTHLYTADARRDPTMKGFVEYITHRKEREDIAQNKSKQRFLEECLLLERDLFGPYRLDKFANRQFVFHCIDLDEFGRDEDAYRMVHEIEAFQKHANLIVSEEEKHDGRWKCIEVRCGPEEPESPPWSTHVFNEALGRKVEVLFDEPIVGRPDTADKRIRVDGSLYPKSSAVSVEFPQEVEDESFMGRLWRWRYDHEREYRPELWNKNGGK